MGGQGLFMAANKVTAAIDQLGGVTKLTAAEQALVSAGLTGYRREGQRLMAPAKELNRYNAAMLARPDVCRDLVEGSALVISAK